MDWISRSLSLCHWCWRRWWMGECWHLWWTCQSCWNRMSDIWMNVYFPGPTNKGAAAHCRIHMTKTSKPICQSDGIALEHQTKIKNCNKAKKNNAEQPNDWIHKPFISPLVIIMQFSHQYELKMSHLLSATSSTIIEKYTWVWLLSQFIIWWYFLYSCNMQTFLMAYRLWHLKFMASVDCCYSCKII